MPATSELAASSIAYPQAERFAPEAAQMCSPKRSDSHDDPHEAESQQGKMMPIRHNAAAIAVATVMFGSAIRIATAGNRDMSRTTVSVCEDTRAHRVETVASVGKDEIAQRSLAASTATSEDNRPNNTVREGEAAITELGVGASAITYWEREPDGWHVVTTVDIRLGEDQDNDPKQQAVVRFSAVLLPGQLQRISVPAAGGERQQVLCIRRRGDQLEVALVFGPSV